MSIEFEDKIDKILNEDVVIPDSVLQKKGLAFNEIRKNKNKKSKFPYKWVAAASIMFIAITGGILFGDTAIAEIKKTIFHKDAGIQKAIDNGYIQNIESNIMKDKGVQIRVSNVIKDSKRFAINLSVKFDDKSLLKHLKSISIRYTMKTDNGDVLRNGYCNYTLNKEKEEVILNDILLNGPSKGDFNSFDLKIDRIQLYADASAKIDEAILPKVEEGIMKTLQQQGLVLYKVFEGTWKTDASIKLDARFKDIKPIEYNASQNNDYIKVTSGKLLPTGMDITFDLLKIKDFIKEEDLKEIEDSKLVDEKGNIYKQTRILVQGDKTATMTFPVTVFDKVGNLKLIVKSFQGEIYEIKLDKAR